MNTRIDGGVPIVPSKLRHDPKNPEAAEFLKIIQSYLERRQAQQRVEDAILLGAGLDARARL